ncbi:MAG TPA: DUF2252 family protein [Mycobacterium sp.]|nr:DUF2252 family protein [Mycobacterium sp.]
MRLLSVKERHDLGRARRSVLPRSALGDFVTAEHRADPVTLLESQAPSRIPELMPIRYGRMLASPFAFFRGAALIMAADLAAGEHTGLTAQLCGNAHLSNFGLFASPERNLVFDVTDFDETLPGPWEWDVKRFVASLAVAARTNAFAPPECERVARSCARAYRNRMQTLAGMRELDVWYAHTAIDDALQASVEPKYAHTIRRTGAKAASRDNLAALSKLTAVVQGDARPRLIPIDELVGEADARRYEQHLGGVLDAYQQSLEPARRLTLITFQRASVSVCAGVVSKPAGIDLPCHGGIVCTDTASPMGLIVRTTRSSTQDATIRTVNMYLLEVDS